MVLHGSRGARPHRRSLTRPVVVESGIAPIAPPRLFSVLAAAARLAACLVVSAVLLGSWVRPLHAVVRGDLHGDSSILTWDLWNVTESTLHLEDPYLTRLLYYPVGGALTSHTYAPGFLPVGLVTKALDGGDPAWPIAAYRAAIWLCFGLGLFVSHGALRALGASPLAAICGSLAWTFAPVFRSRALETHLVSATFLVPAITWALSRLLAQPTRGRALAFGLVTGSCVFFSEYYAPFLWLGLLLLGAFAALDPGARRSAASVARALGWRGLAAAAGAFVVATSPFLLHWSPSKALRFRERQAYFESSNLAGFLVPDPMVTPVYSRTRLAGWNGRVRRGVGGAQIFLGFPVLLLALAGVVGGKGIRGRLLAFGGVAFLVLSLGPELKVLATNTHAPLPYRALMLVPPFDLARAPARLSALGLWGLVGLMALFLTSLDRRLGRRWSTLAAIVAGVWVLLEALSPGPAVDAFQPPPGLRRLGPGCVANLPLSSHDSYAMLLQVFHGRPIVTGYLSRITAAQSDSVGRLDALLAEGPASFADAMRAEGCGNVIASPGATDDVVTGLIRNGLVVVDLRRTD